MKVLCYDIGGTDIKYGIIEDGELLFKDSMKTDAFLGQDALVKKLIWTTKDILKKNSVVGVGISCAGSVDINKGVITIAPEDISEFGGLNFNYIFKENFNLPCVADNDVNCFALAEGKTGAAKNMKNYLTMTVGTGIGGAIVIDNKLWRGANFNGAEFGRMLLNDRKFEALASTQALVRNARKAGIVASNGIDVFDAYDKKDITSIPVVKEFFNNLARGIANLFYIFDPEAIIIGGGISNRKQLSTEIKRELKRIMVADFFVTTKVLNAKHGNDGGILGAYYNFMNVYYPNQL